MKIEYINRVELQGIVGDHVIWKRARNGKSYVSFQVITNNSSEYVSEYETESKEYIRIIVFNNNKTKFVDRLKKAGLRRGMWISLEGKLQTSKIEIKGNPIIQLVVHPKRIWFIDKEGNKTEV